MQHLYGTHHDNSTNEVNDPFVSKRKATTTNQNISWKIKAPSRIPPQLHPNPWTPRFNFNWPTMSSPPEGLLKDYNSLQLVDVVITPACNILNPAVEYGDMGEWHIIFGRVNYFEVVDNWENYSKYSSWGAHMICMELLKINWMKVEKWKR